MTRKERLQAELKAAEEKLDGIGRSRDPGLMRTQQDMAGQRARVYTLRSELRRMEADAILGKSENALERRKLLNSEATSFLVRVKEAELAARAASQQAHHDEVRELLRRLDDADAIDEEIAQLHH